MKNQLVILIVVVLLGFFLRFINVSNNPPGLYIDEASIGYNAYNLLTVGKDEYGRAYPLWFQSFGDYKLPVYIYSVVGTMAVLGKTELAVRLPSVIAGTATIAVIYFFLEKLIYLETDKKLQKRIKYLPLLASSLLAISSWHIHFSRGGFEVTVGTFFYLLGWYLFLSFKDKHRLISIIMCIISFLIALYTYDIFRFLSILAFLYIAFDLKIYKKKKSYYFVLPTLLLSLPMILFSLTTQGSERFESTSAFSQIAAVSVWQKILLYPLVYLNNYFSFFSLDFLFNFGDGIGRHQIPNFGELYLWQLPFFLAGIYFLCKQAKSKITFLTFFFFISTPIIAAIAVPSPHALRSLPLVIPSVIATSVGLIFFIQNLKKLRIMACTIIALIALYQFVFYLHFYYIHYPRVNELDWGAGYKQLVLTTDKYKGKYKHIIIDTNLAYAPIYFHFYDNSIPFTVVTPTWKKPKSWGNYSVLYLRPYYNYNGGDKLIDTIYLDNINHDIFAQLWTVK